MGRSWLGRLFRGDERPREPGMPLPGDAPRFAAASEGRAHRVTKTLSAADPRTGATIWRSGVGVSTSTRGEAESMARTRAERALHDALASRIGAGEEYAYAADRRLEPLVEILRDGPSEIARVTVNLYGALVLNAAAALFVDVDGDGGHDPDAGPPDELGAVLERRRDLHFRVYRTRAGWRYLCATRLFDPLADETHALLTELGADERYVLLCRVQRSFRARLTPKPWRARYREIHVSTTEGIARETLQRYIDRTWGYATARRVGGAALDETLPELRALVEYHDRWTQANSDKPLA